MKTTSRVASFIPAVLCACVLGAPAASHAGSFGDIMDKAKSAGELLDKVKPSRAEPAAPEPAAPEKKHRTAAQPVADSDPAARFVQDGLRFSILAIDKERRSVTALDRTNGAMFRFKVSNTATLNKLKTCERFDAELGDIAVGQSFTADFPAAKGEPCCTLATPVGGAGQALGVRAHGEYEGFDMILLGFKRIDGDIVQATWQYCNGSNRSVDWSLVNTGAFGSAYLLDPATQTKHKVATDDAGRGLTAQRGDSFLKPSETIKAWAKFSSPESDVVTVVLPGVEPFEGVSLVAPTALVPPPVQPVTAPRSEAPAPDTESIADRGAVGDGDAGVQDDADAQDDEDAQDDDEPIEKPSARNAPPPGPTLRSGAKPTHLQDYPDAQKMLDEIAKGIAAKEIDVALIGGEKYKINGCLGVKASSGTFRLKFASPNARIEGSGARLTFRIDRVSINALKIRMKPNAGNPLKPCHWSKKFTVGGAATDIHYELRFDPILDLQQCKLGSLGNVKHRLDIGGLNLKPLQNDLDRAAKNMLEDAFNNAANFNMSDRIIASANAFLGVQCHK